MEGVHLLCLGGAKGGATVGLYQNGGYDESMLPQILIRPHGRHRGLPYLFTPRLKLIRSVLPGLLIPIYFLMQLLPDFPEFQFFQLGCEIDKYSCRNIQRELRDRLQRIILFLGARRIVLLLWVYRFSFPEGDTWSFFLDRFSITQFGISSPLRRAHLQTYSY